MGKIAVLLLFAILLLGGWAQPLQLTLPDVRVTEGDPAGMELININTRNNTFTQINNHDINIFLEHFNVTPDGRVITKNVVDRDLIASRLQRQHEPVFFSITIDELYDFEVQRSTTVILHVLDLDDNAPRFPNPFLQLSINEGSQTSMADTVIPRAEDDDEGINTVLNYTLTPPDGVFTLDIRRDDNNFITELRLVQNQELDREIESSYTLHILATEGNANPDSAMLTINVTIEDVCDEAPHFLITRYFIDVEENRDPYTILRNISAIDLDLRPNISYSISRVCAMSPCETVTSHPFRLNMNMDMESGDLVITEALDREEIAQYEITILAEDDCMSTGTATVVVTVLNVNDNPPELTVLLSASNVTENVQADFIVYFLLVTDDDDADTMFTYEVIDTGTSLPTSLFYLVRSNQQYELKTTQPLDREMFPDYMLLLNVTDWGSPNMSSQLSLPVVVLDVNDNPPIFDPVQEVHTVSENVDGMIMQLRATDSDSFETGNGLVSYLLPESNSSYPHQGLFSIDQEGYLTATGILDREEQATLRVLVQARDNPSDNADSMSDFVEVNLVLSDENDNTPIILTPPEVVVIREDHPNDAVVFTVTAMDDDTTPFSTLTFSLISPTAAFRIDPATGNVTLVSSLDFEEVTSYTILVEATDGELTGNRTVTVMVQDVNDERCQFSITNPNTLPIHENRNEGQLVVTITASDRDTPDNELQFHITSGNDLGHFRIDATSGHGEIRTTTMLDHDHVMNYTLRISCSDGPATPNEIEVIVQVLDENDNVPVFTQDSYSFSIPEGRHEGSNVGIIEANDIDSGDNGLVHYRIISSTPSSVRSWFRLDNVTGQITTTQVIDREHDFLVGVEDSRISLNVEAHDVPDRFNTTIVTVTILDINDEGPVFANRVMNFELPENYPLGMDFPNSIIAVDPDAPPFNAVTYTISGRSVEAMSLFRITPGEDAPNTGVLSLTATLDFEDVARHEFTVVATDSAITNMEDTITVIVNVTNVAETNIKFCEFATTKDVHENAPIGKNVSKFLVTDLNGNPLMMNLPELMYNITQDGTTPVNFGITNDTANSMLIIYVKGAIDREAYGAATVIESLLVTAFDPSTSDQSYGSTSAILKVTIVDENDNSPAFSHNVYVFNVMENLDPLSIGRTPATDPDSGRNGTLGITYSISDSFPFSIDSNGELRTTRDLDRENTSRYDFTVVAADGGPDPRSANVPVTVIVLDENDNYPLFDVNQNRTFVVGEETSVNTIVANLHASDADVGSYGNVTFQPGNDNDNSHFSVGLNGSIMLVQSLDREAKSRHLLHVQAIDGGGQRTLADVYIVVRDYNDNPPVFDPVSDIKVMEDTEEGEIIATVTAQDDDIGSNGDVNYAIGNYSLSFLFSINPVSGEISLRSQHSACDSSVIDYERQSKYYLSIVAYDLGSPRHIVATTIEISIGSVNEYLPMFDKARIQTYVNETQRNGEEVLRIRAVDRDLDDQIIYEVYEGDIMSSLFRYDQASGAILNTGILDYNTASQYILTLQASDMDSNIGTTQVEVNVININNHAPVFEEDRPPNTANQPIVVSESISVSTVLHTVRATDEDNITHDAVSYFLESNENNGEFSIDPLTGEISVSSALDFETGQEYTLRVMARDTGFPQLTSTPLTLIISVVNENDESPIFNSSSYTFLFQEDQPEGSVVGTVYAPDRDVGSFGDVQYSISGGVNQYFDINRDNGQIFTRVRIDRDSLSSVTFDFSVLATDGAPGLAVRTAGADVTITIVDINDNPPVFSSPQYLVTISPNQAPSVSLATLTVSDRDEGVNAEYRYEINPQSEGEVQLQLTSTGSLSLVRTIPSSYQPVYIYTVRATDARDRTLYSTARVELIVETENDHHPVFSPVRSSIFISELETVGTEVIQLREVVTDGDTGENGMLSYQLVDDHLEFQIDGESGAISLRELLDYESTRAYNLTVMALDHRPGVRRTATGVIEVTVEPKNEHAPVFVGVPSQLTLSYLPEYGLELFTVGAMDGDEGDDGIVKYNLFDSTSYFTIERETGILRNQGVLTSDDTFNLIIGAYDLGNPFMTSNTTITVTIRDPDETTPIFMEENPRTIMQAETDNLDGFLNTAFVTNPQAQTYHIVKQTVFGETMPIDMFAIIDESDSRLSILAPLDYEDIPQYSMVVESRRETRTDTSIERKSDFLVVTLVVTDVNDNVPLFSAVEDQTFSEDTDVGMSLFRVYAVDDDSGLEGEVVYDIIQGDEDTFSINSTTGDVFLNQHLDRETISEYDLVIRAQDLSNSPQPSQVIVHVDVTDVNDFVTTYNNRNYSLGVYEFPYTRMGDEIVQLAATDEDVGPPLDYDMEFVGARSMGNRLEVSQLTNPFDIHPDTGLITVASLTLDRESVDHYTLRVIATDRTHTADTYLFIEVLDVNESPPTPTYPGEVDILEGLPVDTLVTDQISVTDPDLGVNSWVLFSLGGGWPEGYFSIDPVSGVIRTTAITTAMDTFSGTVVAEDQGFVQHRITFDIIVNIVDVNDNPPLFESESITLDVSIAESSNFGIYSFTVTDADFGVNSSPYMLTIPSYYEEVHDNFYLRPGNRELTLRVGQTKSRSYNFVIFASNPSQIPRCVEYNAASAINVTVNVRPINVACPQFPHALYEIDVLEETAFTESLALITSDDPDGDTVEYTLVDAPTLPFMISPRMGNLMLVGTLDREEQDTYSLTVVATDDGFPAMSCSVAVVVTVLDVNDHQPRFQQDTYTGTLAENLPVNSFILTVNATDEDLGEAGTIRYSLGETDAPFRIDATSGRIFSTLTLDFDTLSTGSYVFSAIASDISMSSSILVTIDVTDINEHMPMFITTPTEDPIQVSEQRGKGSTLGTFNANDADRGAELLYSFGMPIPECYFDINNRTGTVTLKIDPNMCGTCVDNLIRRPSSDDPEYYIIDTTLIVSDGTYEDDMKVSFMLHNSFCVSPAGGPLPVEIIAGSITVFLVIVLILLCVIVFACVCRSRRSLKVTINDAAIEMPKRFESGKSSAASTPAPIYKQTSMSHEHTTMSITHSGSGASSARQSYTCGDMDAVDQNVLYPSPSMISRKSQLSRPCRSTSDLESSNMGMDMLSGESQEPPPYPKAQIEKIYAKNADLLNHSDSNESIHMFGSEGGGESDGGDDMLFAKFNDLDDDDDSVTMQDDDEDDRSYQQRRSMSNSRDNLSIPPVMDDPYGFEHPAEMWVPRASEMADAIDQMAIGSYKTEDMNTRRAQQHYMSDYNKSQEGVSMYGASTQESTRPLLRHAHPHSQSRMAPHHMMQPTGYSSYENSPAEVRHHGVRDPQLSYGGPPAGMPIYPPMTRHGGGASQEVPGPYAPMARHGGGASQEVPGPYGYHAEFMHRHPMHHEMGGVDHSPSSSSTPTEGTLNTRAMTNEYESDINIYSSDTSINTNTESDPPHLRGPRFSQSGHSQGEPPHLRGPGFSQSGHSQGEPPHLRGPGFSQSGHSQGDTPHIRGFSQSQGESPHIRGFSQPGHSQRHPNYR